MALERRRCGVGGVWGRHVRGPHALPGFIRSSLGSTVCCVRSRRVILKKWCIRTWDTDFSYLSGTLRASQKEDFIISLWYLLFRSYVLFTQGSNYWGLARASTKQSPDVRPPRGVFFCRLVVPHLEMSTTLVFSYLLSAALLHSCGRG